MNREDVRESELYATARYMRGSEKVFPLCGHDFVVQIKKDFTLCCIKITDKLRVYQHHQYILK